MVFRRLDYTLWRSTAHNPVRMLWAVPQARLEAAVAGRRLRAPVRPRASPGSTMPARPGGTWWSTRLPQLAGQTIAYFSAEFALHQSLPIYAGGLGVLAGDHCKESSDLGVPLIGVGFMYPQGYFHQHVSAEGWQEESYERLNWADAPIEHGADARRQAVRHGGPARRSHGAGGGVARAARPRHAVSARHGSRGERAVGSRALGAALRRRSRDARPAGDHPRHRRRPGAQGARLRARRVPPERRPRRVRRAAADPRSHRAGLELRRGARRDPADDGVHHAHARGGRARCVPVLDGREAPGRLLGHARRRPRALSGARRRTTTAAAPSST